MATTAPVTQGLLVLIVILTLVFVTQAHVSMELVLNLRMDTIVLVKKDTLEQTVTF